MAPSDIILLNCKKYGWDQSKLIGQLARLLDSKKAALIQKNNTLVIVRDIGDNIGEIHVYSEDSPLKFIASLKSIVLQIKETSISAIYGKPNNEEVMRAFELATNKTGIKISPSDKPDYSFKATRA